MSYDKIIAKVRKPNSDDDNSESEEEELIKTSKISNSNALEYFAKRLMWLEEQPNSDTIELILLKQVHDRVTKQSQLCFQQSNFHLNRSKEIPKDLKHDDLVVEVQSHIMMATREAYSLYISI